jgi:hypothetical protein
MEVSPAVVELLAERAANLDAHLRESWKEIERKRSGDPVPPSDFRLGMQRGYAVALSKLHGRTIAQIEIQLQEQVRNEQA